MITLTSADFKLVIYLMFGWESAVHSLCRLHSLEITISVVYPYGLLVRVIILGVVEVILPQLVLTPKCLIFRHMTLPVSRYVLGGELKRSDGAQLPVLVIRSSCFTQWRPMPVHDVTYGNSKAHYFLLSPGKVLFFYSILRVHLVFTFIAIPQLVGCVHGSMSRCLPAKVPSSSNSAGTAST